MKNFEELPKKEYTEYTEFIKEMNSAFAGELAIRFNNETIMITSFSANTYYLKALDGEPITIYQPYALANLQIYHY